MQLSGDSTPSSVRDTSNLPMIVSDFSSSARFSKIVFIFSFITLHLSLIHISEPTRPY